MRRYRFNAWHGNSAGHRKAAFKGYRSWLARASRGGKRSIRKNRGSRRSHVSSAKSLVTRSIKTLPMASTILLGNVGATWGSEQLANFLPIIRTNKYAEVLSLFGLGIVEGIASHMFPARGITKIIHDHSNDFYIGGMLAGVTRSLKYIFPGTFQTCGIGEEGMDGLGDWFASAGPHGNVARAWPNTHGWPRGQHGPYHHPTLPFHPQHMTGIGAYPSPSAPVIEGMGDYAAFGSTNPSALVHQNHMNPASHMHPMHLMHSVRMQGMGDAIGEVNSEISSMA